MALFDGLGGITGTAKRAGRSVSRTGFDPAELKRFMQLGNELAGTETVDITQPEFIKSKSRKDLVGSQDQIQSLLSIFKKRTQTIGQRTAQPGLAQTRIV